MTKMQLGELKTLTVRCLQHVLARHTHICSTSDVKDLVNTETKTMTSFSQISIIRDTVWRIRKDGLNRR